MPETMPASPGFISSSFFLESNQSIYNSFLSGQVQRKARSNAIWVARYVLPPMQRSLYSDWVSFFNKLEGNLYTFYAYDPHNRVARGELGGTPKVNGADQTGSSLITDGWPTSQNNVLLPGDYFSVNGELKVVTNTVNSDTEGDATIEFKPPLRNSPSDNADLTVTNTQVEMILTFPEQARFVYDKNGYSQQLSFEGREVFS